LKISGYISTFHYTAAQSDSAIRASGNDRQLAE